MITKERDVVFIDQRYADINIIGNSNINVTIPGVRYNTCQSYKTKWLWLKKTKISLPHEVIQIQHTRCEVELIGLWVVYG